MLRGRLLRGKAVVVAVVLLNGGGGMPFLDVVLYHRHAVTRPAATYVAACDAQRPHGEVCRLGWTLPYSLDGRAADPGLPVLAVPFHRPAAPRVTAPRSADRGALPQPRAPPSLLP